jgi:glycosyltransferase involved in cell wall biosynthesis
MNVLYIGNFLDHHGGWSNASNMWVKALYRAFPDTLAIRYFRYGKDKQPATPLVKKLLARSFDKYDIVIQNILPTEMERIEGCYNIGIFYTESEGVLTSGLNNWASKLSTMDNLWVTTERESLEVNRAGLKCDIVPQSIDVDHIKSFNYEPMLGERNNYRFYVIGAEGQRKNIMSVLIAFRAAFEASDPVELIIKGSDVESIKSSIQIASQIVKDRDPLIRFVENELSDDEMLGLHADCDCYISASSEESIGRPLMVAATMGKACLVTDGTSMTEIPNVYTINSEKGMCICNNPPAPGIYTYREQWFVPNVLDIQLQYICQSY